MASLSLRNIYKIYSGGVTAVTDFNLEIEDKEFIILVGPSGCGKSTTLRMIAGLEEISKGELYIGDTLSNDIAPKDRDIAMVFQNYALYPHMTVYDNMAFGLKLRKTPKDEIKRRDPKVFLLDEPLSNLDAKLRAQMRTEISKLHIKLGTTFIYVTHDQTEAMTMGDRIVVMKDGFIQQVDTPQNLYEFPVNEFVAGFMGSPQMNFIDAKVAKSGSDYTLTFGACTITVPQKKAEGTDIGNYVGKEVVFGIRPEDVHDEPDFIEKVGGAHVTCEVEVTELMGAETYLYLNCEGNAVTARVEPTSTAKPGDKCKIAFDLNKMHVFDKETEVTILN
nr:ATP-binding cassette domain-containing protein [Acutalibacter muris]